MGVKASIPLLLSYFTNPSLFISSKTYPVLYLEFMMFYVWLASIYTYSGENESSMAAGACNYTTGG